MTDSYPTDSEPPLPPSRRAGWPRAAWWWVGACLVLVALFFIDEPVMRVLYPHRVSGLAEFIRQRVRVFGTGTFQIPALLLLLLVGLRLRGPLLRAAPRGLLAFATSGIAVNALKVLVHRQRPWHTDPAPTAWIGYLHDGAYQSFPSAETATTFAVATAIGAILPRTRGPLLLLGAVIGVGRVIVAVHHPSDVWAGAMLGVICGQAALRMRWTAETTAALRRAAPLLLLALYAALVLFGGLGRLPLYGRDESLYAEAAREMHASGDWIVPRVNGATFFEKPPLNYWLVAASYHLFGVTPLAARLLSALLGLATVLLVAVIGARVWGRRAGLLAGFVLASCLQVAFIGRMGIMDVPLMFLTTLALVSYLAWRRRGHLGYALAFGAVVGAALLLKSLAGLIPALVVFVHAVIFHRPKLHAWVLPALAAIAMAAVVAVPWFLVIGAREPAFWSTFVNENFRRMGHAMQGHSGNLLYYVGFILLGFFPWVMFLPAAFRRGLGAGEIKHLWRSLCVVWFAVVLIFFTLLTTKLPGYIVPLFPAMALLVGRELDRRLEEQGRAPWVAVLIGAALLGAVVGIGVPIVAARLGAKVGAEAAARQLLPAAYAWGAAYLLIAVGAAFGWGRRPRAGLQAMAVGQTAAVGVVLLWIAPMLVPYQEGGRESRLVELARANLPRHEIVLYEANPQGAAFTLERSVPVYGNGEEARLLAHLRQGPTALITPAGRKRPAFLDSVAVARTWTVGNYQVCEVEDAKPRP